MSNIVDLSYVFVRVLDICPIDYLTDHHNRDGELLIGTPLSYNPDPREALLEIHSAIILEASKYTFEDLPIDLEEFAVKLLKVLKEENPYSFMTDDLEDESQVWILIEF